MLAYNQQLVESIVLFFISLLIFYLPVLEITERGMLKSLTVIVNLFISP